MRNLKITIEGTPGSGKVYLAKQIAHMIENLGGYKPIVIIEGETNPGETDELVIFVKDFQSKDFKHIIDTKDKDQLLKRFADNDYDVTDVISRAFDLGVKSKS